MNELGREEEKEVPKFLLFQDTGRRTQQSRHLHSLRV